MLSLLSGSLNQHISCKGNIRFSCLGWIIGFSGRGDVQCLGGPFYVNPQATLYFLTVIIIADVSKVLTICQLSSKLYVFTYLKWPLKFPMTTR